MSAPLEPVLARPNVEPPPHPSEAGDDVLGWAMLALVVGVGLAGLFSPFKDYAFFLGALCFVVTVWLMAEDALARKQRPALWVFGGLLLFPVVFPLFMHERRRWGAPWRLPHALVALVALGAGVGLHGKVWGPAAKVTVSCRAKGMAAKEGYLCTPKHVSGYQDARACWDLTLVCKNGTRLTEHVCAQVTLGDVRESYVPFEYSPGADQCDEIAAASVDDLRVEVDAR